MEKYQCEDCGHIFEGDLSTMQCPNCGSANIKKAKTGIPIKWKYVGIAVAVGGIICLIIARIIRDDKLVASMQVKEGIVSIEVEGVNPTKLNKEYKVAVYDQSNKEHGLTAFLKKKKIAQYSTMYMLEGQCYTFNIERKDGASIKNLKWKTSNEYCVPTPAPRPEIDHIEQGVADHVNLVWNKIKVVMKKEGKFFYSIVDGKFQSSPVFNGIQPGNYTVVVRNEEGVTVSQPLILREIKRLAPPLTLQEVQDIFDKVSNGSMSAATAQDKLAEGNVNLTREVQPGNIKTLWGALMEAEMGEKFVVNSFENDPNTNKIKSGSLTISRR